MSIRKSAKKIDSRVYALAIVMVIALVVGLVGAYAANGPNGSNGANNAPLKSAELGAANSQVACRANFTIGVIQSLQGVSSTPDLSSQVSNLQNDLTHLNTLQQGGNLAAFRAYVQGTFDVHLKDARLAVAQWRTDNRGNLTDSQKNSIATTYSTLKTSFDSCTQDTLKQLGDERVQDFTDEVSRLQNVAENLSSRGVDVSGINTVLQDAQTQIITPLQNAVSSAQTTSDLQNAVKGYCLYNGCTNGTDYHLEARFEIAKINSVVSFLQGKNITQAGQSDLTQASNQANAAKTILDGLNNRNATPDQEKQMWTDIISAYGSLKQARAAGGSQ